LSIPARGSARSTAEASLHARLGRSTVTTEGESIHSGIVNVDARLRVEPPVRDHDVPLARGVRDRDVEVLAAKDRLAENVPLVVELRDGGSGVTVGA